MAISKKIKLIRRKFFWGGFAMIFVIIFLSIFAWAAMHGSGFGAAFLRAVTRAQLLSVKIPQATVLLPVKFDKQDHALSCEAAGLKMVLAYRGVNVDEDELLERIGVEPVARPYVHGDGADSAPNPAVSGTVRRGELIWGDPQKGFVGNVDGKMFRDGYGVHWDPVARTAKEYRPAYAITHYDIPALVYELDHGNPIIVWAYLASGKPTSWKTPDGEVVSSVYYEHIFVVNGYSGPKDVPSGFHVIDTLYGPRFYSTAEFLKRWNAFGRSGVVVL